MTQATLRPMQSLFGETAPTQIRTQLEMPKSSILQAAMTSLAWTNSPVTYSLANSIVKEDGNETAAKCSAFDLVS